MFTEFAEAQTFLYLCTSIVAMVRRLLISLIAAIMLAGCFVWVQPEPVDPDTANPDSVDMDAIYADTTLMMMQQFIIAKAENPQLKNDMVFEYDSLTNTFSYTTQRWIEGIDSLRPTFVADGEVYIGDKKQLSGVTSCDFSNRIVEFTVRDTALLTQNKCTVSIISPQTTGLPVMRIDIEGNRVVAEKDRYLPADFTIKTADSTIAGSLEIRGRGNTTWSMRKKPYKIKLAKSAPLFGMHKARTWVLLANFQDVTLLTNTVAFELARRMEMPFTNHGQHLELYLNGKYEGNYLLTEQIDVHKGRVEVDTLAGGFLAEIDLNFDEEYKWTSTVYKLPVMLQKPESSASLEQVKTVFTKIERLLSRANPSYERLSELVDMQSLVRYMILNELVYNIELGHPKSVYCFRRNANAPLEWGPVWDFDWAFGYTGYNYDYFHEADKLMFDISQQSGKMWGAGGEFFTRFTKMPEFCELYRQEWQKVLPQVSTIGSYIWTQGQMLDNSWIENRKRWGSPDVMRRNSYMEMMVFVDRRTNLITESTRR